MATTLACPKCGTSMREIVWGFGTLTDMEEQGDVVVGGCVVDVDEAGRVAFAECPSCGTRADEHGIALERTEPAPTGGHPFAVSFSSPPSTKWEVSMPDVTQPPEAAAQGGQFAAEDFGAARSAPDTWRDQVEPYSSHDDELPPPSAPAPDHVEPYASREDAVPQGGGAIPDRVEPYSSHADDVPAPSAPAREQVEPYSSHDDAVPGGNGLWQERVEPFASGGEAGGAASRAPSDEAVGGPVAGADPGEPVPGEQVSREEPVPEEPVPGEAVPDAPSPEQPSPEQPSPEQPLPGAPAPGEPVPGVAEHLDPYARQTSRFTDAEEEGWPPPYDGDDDDEGPYPMVR